MSETEATLKPISGVRVVLVLAVSGLVFATLAGRAGRVGWLLDLFSHYVVYYAVAALVVGMTAVFFRRWVVAVLALLVLLVNGLLLTPQFFQQTPAAGAHGRPLSIALVNILHKNRDRDSALAFIRSCDSDLMIIQEIDPWWEGVIREAGTRYRFEVSEPGEGSFGMALLVHESVASDEAIEIESTDVIDFADGHDGALRPSIELTLKLDGRRVKILSIHPPPPMSGRLTALRDSVIRRAKDWANKQTVPHIIIGDLNTTPWSYAFKTLVGDGELVSSQVGRGNQGTWPTMLPVPWKLPIDHCVYSGQWVCLKREVGAQTGSDHLPLLVTVALAGGVDTHPSPDISDTTLPD